MKQQRGRSPLVESTHKPETPREFSKMPRSEDQIRTDLRAQLEEMHKHYLEKWVWPRLGDGNARRE